jgi:hypothetical protein
MGEISLRSYIFTEYGTRSSSALLKYGLRHEQSTAVVISAKFCSLLQLIMFKFADGSTSIPSAVGSTHANPSLQPTPKADRLNAVSNRPTQKSNFLLSQLKAART